MKVLCQFKFSQSDIVFILPLKLNKLNFFCIFFLQFLIIFSTQLNTQTLKLTPPIFSQGQDEACQGDAGARWQLQRHHKCLSKYPVNLRRWLLCSFFLFLPHTMVYQTQPCTSHKHSLIEGFSSCLYLSSEQVPTCLSYSIFGLAALLIIPMKIGINCVLDINICREDVMYLSSASYLV